MGLFKFLARHLWGAVVAVVLAAIAVAGFMLDAYSVISLGLPPSVWAIVGIILLFGVTIRMLYQFDQQLFLVEGRLKDLENQRVAAGSISQEAANQQREDRENILKMGGLVRAYAEFTAQYEPLDTTRYSSMRARIALSHDPVWIDDILNQLRRDVLHYGDEVAGTRVDHSRNDSVQMREAFGRAVDSLLTALILKIDGPDGL